MKKFNWQSLRGFPAGSVLMILCGGILTVSPDSASILLSAVIGWLLIAGGVLLLALGVLDGARIVTVVQGALLLVAGVWLHRHPLMIASVLGTVLGLIALCQGWRKGKQAMVTKLYGGFWVWDAAVAALELLTGLVLILTPLTLSRLVLALAGMFMVICGAVDLVASWKNRPRLDGSDNIIDAD